jgi:hypothetical protein
MAVHSHRSKCASRDDHDDKRERRDQIEVPGIVNPVTGFPLTDVPTADFPALIGLRTNGKCGREARVPVTSATRISLGSTATGFDGTDQWRHLKRRT